MSSTKNQLNLFMSNFGSFDIDLEKDHYVLLIVIFDSNSNEIQPPKSLFKVNLLLEIVRVVVVVKRACK